MACNWNSGLLAALAGKKGVCLVAIFTQDKEGDNLWKELLRTKIIVNYYPGQKKRTMLLMPKIRILLYQGIGVLDSAAKPRTNATCNGATSRIDASRRNHTADSSISHDELPRWFFFFFVQGSTFFLTIKQILSFQCIEVVVGVVTHLHHGFIRVSWTEKQMCQRCSIIWLAAIQERNTIYESPMASDRKTRQSEMTTKSSSTPFFLCLIFFFFGEGASGDFCLLTILDFTRTHARTHARACDAKALILTIPALSPIWTSISIGRKSCKTSSKL